MAVGGSGLISSPVTCFGGLVCVVFLLAVGGGDGGFLILQKSTFRNTFVDLLLCAVSTAFGCSPK